jgi:hypothetical protein
LILCTFFFVRDPEEESKRKEKATIININQPRYSGENTSRCQSMRRLCKDTNVGDLAVLGEGLQEEKKKHRQRVLRTRYEMQNKHIPGGGCHPWCSTTSFLLTRRDRRAGVSDEHDARRGVATERRPAVDRRLNDAANTHRRKPWQPFLLI